MPATVVEFVAAGQLREHFPCTCDAAFYCACRHVTALRRLLIGKPVPADVAQRLLMPLGQKLDALDGLFCGDCALGIRIAIGQMLIGCVGHDFAPMTAMMSRDSVAKNCEQPGLLIRARNKAVPVFPGLQHRGLGKILVQRLVLAAGAKKAPRISFCGWQQCGQRFAELKFLIVCHGADSPTIVCEALQPGIGTDWWLQDSVGRNAASAGKLDGQP